MSFILPLPSDLEQVFREQPPPPPIAQGATSSYLSFLIVSGREPKLAQEVVEELKTHLERREFIVEPPDPDTFPLWATWAASWNGDLEEDETLELQPGLVFLGPLKEFLNDKESDFFGRLDPGGYQEESYIEMQARFARKVANPECCAILQVEGVP